jgi:hypothetical protein
MTAAAIKDTITAYSTAVGPSSSRRNLRRLFEKNFDISVPFLATIRTISGVHPSLSTVVSSATEPAVKEFFRFLLMKMAFQRYNPTER